MRPSIGEILVVPQSKDFHPDPPSAPSTITPIARLHRTQRSCPRRRSPSPTPSKRSDLPIFDGEHLHPPVHRVTRAGPTGMTMIHKVRTGRTRGWLTGLSSPRCRGRPADTPQSIGDRELAALPPSFRLAIRGRIMWLRHAVLMHRMRRIGWRTRPARCPLTHRPL